MQAIANHVYIEDQFAGVTLGAIALPHGLIQIDAPPSSEDSRIWRASLLNLGSGPERILINLDAHPDRTLGARAMDCTILAHEKTANTFRSRPTTFKAQGDDTGADWENIPGLGNIRWAPPEISFTQNMTLHWGESTVLLEHHPGPSAGALWVILPEEKVAFVGDAVLKNQPPFLSNANLDMWLETLDWLAGQYKGYILVSGRGGLVNQANVKSQVEYLQKLKGELDVLNQKHASAEATEVLIPPLLAACKAPPARQKQYLQRLKYGLNHYYNRHYRSNNASGDE